MRAQISRESFHLECVQKTGKHGGGKVMLWGLFTASSTRDLLHIEETIN